jgi:O-antigen chain-terminating methyltransferase
MRDVEPIIEEIRQLAAERRARPAGEAEEADATPLVAPVDLRTPVTIREGHPLRWFLALADRVRARVLEAILIRQSEFNRQVGSGFTSVTHRFEEADRERADLHDLCETLITRIDDLALHVAALERRLTTVPAAAQSPARDGSSAPGDGGPPIERRAADLCRDPAYARLEAALRGDEPTIRERQRAYVDLFAGAEGSILDIGCGRGEFLDLLRDAGRAARGVDRSPDNVRLCRGKGLDVVEGDALEYLSSLDDGSLSGLFGAQFIEHVGPEYLLALLRAAFAKLRPGARIALETINADALATLPTFYADLSHAQPIPPVTAKLLLEACGFRRVEIRYTSAFPPASQLAASGDQSPLAKRFDEAVAKLNQTLWGAREYAVIGTR